MRRALDAGASGYLLKDAPAEKLADAIRGVHQGLRVVDPQLAQDAWGESDPLTDRERQVLRAAEEGLASADIAKLSEPLRRDGSQLPVRIHRQAWRDEPNRGRPPGAPTRLVVTGYIIGRESRTPSPLAFASALARWHQQPLATPAPEPVDARPSSEFPGKAGIWVKHLTTGETAGVRDGEMFNSASVIKIPVLVLAFQMADKGAINLDERITIRKEDIRGGSGIFRYHDAGLQPTFRDVLLQMVITSDNTATDLAIAKVGGVARVNAWLEGIRLRGRPAARADHRRSVREIQRARVRATIATRRPTPIDRTGSARSRRAASG